MCVSKQQKTVRCKDMNRCVIYCVFLVFGIFIKESESDENDGENDPCLSYSELPRKDERFMYNELDYDTFDHDHGLKEGWYRADNLTLVNTPPPGFFSCGTMVPIWMQGDQPKQDEGIVTRKVCSISVFDLCAFGHDIQVKNCGHFYVYNLSPTATTWEGYCFGIDQPTTDTGIAIFVPKDPTVDVQNRIIGKGRRKQDIVYFQCQFAFPNETDKYEYMVEWIAHDFRAGNKFSANTSKVSYSGKREDLQRLELTEMNFTRNGIFYMGIQLGCRVYVNPKDDDNGIRRSEISKFIFVGFNISFSNDTVERGKSITIEIKSSIPIGCRGNTPQTCGAFIYLYMAKECTMASEKSCKIKIPYKQWRKTRKVTLYPVDSPEYEFGGLVEITFRTKDAEGLKTVMWENYHITTKTFKIVEGGNMWKGKKCESNNDPHMRTFDGRRYEHHQAGTYILYRHKQFPAEVQIQLGSCYARVQCNCGVAVRAGREVFVINKCDDTKRIIGFLTECEGDVLSVVSDYESMYKIVFPYGTYITVSLSSTSKWINVQVVSSVHDQEKNSEGLCGQLSGDCMDDFVLRDGRLSQENKGCDFDWRHQPISFLNNWKVSDDENLFTLNQILEKTCKHGQDIHAVARANARDVPKRYWNVTV